MTPARGSLAAEGQVHLPRLADVVADRIRELIMEGELKDGERLPPLDTLLEQFGVSAPSMREALRILEAEGLVHVQRGSVGGALVHRPTAREAGYMLALVLRSHGTRKYDVGEAMSHLEPLCAAQCARRPDRKRTVVRELAKINKEARRLVDGDEVEFNETMLEFHRALVRGCGNDTLVLLTRAVASIWMADMRTWFRSTLAHGQYPSPAERMRELERHERITELIAAGDEVGVTEAMADHFDLNLVFTDGVDPDQRVDPQAVRHSR